MSSLALNSSNHSEMFNKLLVCIKYSIKKKISKPEQEGIDKTRFLGKLEERMLGCKQNNSLKQEEKHLLKEEGKDEF